MWCLKSSFLYGGSRHHQKLKNLNMSFSSLVIPQLFFNFALSSLFPSLFFIWLYIYMSLCPQQHSVIANCSSWFSSKWMWSDPFPLYAKLNPVYSQILHVRSIWNSFKILTVSLSAKEFANETLNLSYLNFRLLPLKPFHFPRYIILFTHDRARSSLLSTWVTHVTRMRRVRGTLVQFPRASSFSLRLYIPLTLLRLHLPRSISLTRSSSQDLAPPLLSSSPVRKSFTASTSSSSYSRRPQISSLRHHRSCLPLPS